MRTITAALPLLVIAMAVPAGAMTHSMMATPSGGARLAPADPDALADRLTDGAARHDRGNAKPDRSLRQILKDDPNLRAAFASLDAR